MVAKHKSSPVAKGAQSVAKAMKKPSGTAPVLKRGKIRQAMRIAKKPARGLWASTPYVKSKRAEPSNQDTLWSMNVTEMFKLTDKQLTKKFMNAGILKNYDYATCPVCGCGTLGKFRVIRTAAP